MIPAFKYYFYPFLYILKEKGSCRMFDISQSVADILKLTKDELQERTKGGRITKHSSRVYYCASYLKKMKLVESYSSGVYSITRRGEEVLNKYGEKLTLNELREIPEFMETRINSKNEDIVYVKAHKRGKKMINGYFCNKKLLRKKNPNIEFLN